MSDDLTTMRITVHQSTLDGPEELTGEVRMEQDRRGLFMERLRGGMRVLVGAAGLCRKVARRKESRSWFAPWGKVPRSMTVTLHYAAGEDPEIVLAEVHADYDKERTLVSRRSGTGDAIGLMNTALTKAAGTEQIMYPNAPGSGGGAEVTAHVSSMVFGMFMGKR